MGKRTNRRELVMLAHVYDPAKHDVSGWYSSEKHDGVRAFWDGGRTRGKPCIAVPWANYAKHGRFRNEQIATGLWTRLGQPIHAPKWFLDALPRFCLDGEMWIGRKKFQETLSIVRKHVPVDAEWKRIQFRVFDAPPFAAFASTPGKLPWGTVIESVEGRFRIPFEDIYTAAKKWNLPEFVAFVAQQKIEDADDLDKRLKAVTKLGGEGLILRNPQSCWTPFRSWDMLKVKPRRDAEATVVGYVWGRKTDKGSKLLGLMGTLVVKWKGKTFEIGTGFTEAERKLLHVREGRTPRSMMDHASLVEVAGNAVDRDWRSPLFPRGSKVTFMYRELTDDGIPKEASYLRKHEAI